MANQLQNPSGDIVGSALLTNNTLGQALLEAPHTSAACLQMTVVLSVVHCHTLTLLLVYL